MKKYRYGQIYKIYARWTSSTLIGFYYCDDKLIGYRKFIQER